MSVALGSAHGDIILDAGGVTKGVQQAASALRAFEAQSSTSGKNLDQIGQAGTRAGGQVAAGARQAEQALATVAARSQTTSQALDRIGTAAGIAGGSLAAGLGVAVKAAADLEKQVANISTIRPDINVGQVGSAIEAMSTRVAQSSSQLAASLYNIFSSVDVSQEQALRLTEQFSQGAVAAQTDAETFGTAILGVMNAYKLSVDDAGHVSDVFFQTVNKGVITGGQLAGVLGNVSQSAKNAGVNFDTLGALIAGITKEGGDAATNVNNLNNVFQKIVTSDVQKGLGDLGIVTKDASGNFRDILAVLGDLDAALGKLSQSDRAQALQKLFPDNQARTGIQTLLSQLQFINATATANAGAVNVASDAYAKMGATASAQATILKNTLLATLTDLGALALPGLVATAGHIKGVVEAFNRLPTEFKGAAVGAVEVAAAFLLIGSAGIKLVSTASELGGALRTVAAAMQSVQVAGVGLGTAFGVAAITGELFVRAITGGQEGLASLAISLIKYGDALHQGREAAAAFIAVHKGDTSLTAFDSQIATLRAHLADLETQTKRFNEGSGPGGVGQTLIEMFTFQQNRRELETANTRKAIEALEAYVKQLQETKQATDDLAASEDFRQRFMQGAAGPVARDQFGTQGPPNIPALPVPPAALGSAISGAATAFAGLANQSSHAYDGVQRVNSALTDLSKAAPAIPVIEGISKAMQGIQANSGPMQVALDALNTKLAQGLPLTAQETALKGQLAGALAANTGAYADLAIAAGAAALAEFKAGTSGAGAAGAIGQAGGSAASASGSVRALEAALIDLNSAFGALSAEDAQLTGFYNKIGERVKVLQQQKDDAAKGKGAFSADDAAELQHWLDLQKDIGKQLGENSAKERDLADQTFRTAQAKREQAAADKAAADAANTADLKAKSDPFASREDRRTAVGKDLPVQVPVTVVPQGPLAGALAAGGAAGLFGGSGNTVPPVPVNIEPTVDNASLAAVRAILGQPVTVPLTLDTKLIQSGLDSATAEAQGIIGGGKGGQTQTITVTADTSAAAQSLRAIQDTLTAINTTPTTAVIGATDNASTIAGTVTTNVKAVPPAHDTILTATDIASKVINDVADAINRVPRSLNITASVDTSGALAQIADLRAHMPASPAKKGPFSRLPNWQSVYASLEPAGAQAVATTQRTVGGMAAALQSGLSEAQQVAAKGNAELITSITGAVQAATAALSAIREVKLPGIGRLTGFAQGVQDLIAIIIDAAKRFDGEGLDSAAKFSESAGKIVALVVPSVAAFKALNDITQPTADQLGVFTAGIVDITLSLVQASRLFDADGLAGAVVLAESATKVVALVKPAVEAFAILPRVMQPTGDQLGVFTQGIIDITLSLVQASRYFDGDGLAGANDLADSAGRIIALIQPAVEGFKLLAQVTQPTADQLGVFTQGVIDISLSLVNASRLFTSEGLAGATALADAALKILGLIKPAVDGFKLLPGIMQPTGSQLGVFTAGITDITLSLVQAGRKFDTEGLAGATALADAATKILGLIKPAVEGFRLLPSIVGVSGANVATFQQGVVAITAAIVQASRLFAADALPQAGTFADTAAKALGLIGTGIAAIKALNGPDFALPDGGRLAGLTGAIRQVVVAIAQAASAVSSDLVSQAADFSDGAGKAVGLVGGAISAFANIADFTPPTVGQIDALKAAILLTIQRIAQAAREIDAESVKAAGEFSDSASKAVSLIGGAISAFTVRTNVDKDGNAKSVDRLLSTAEVDQIVALTRYAVGQLVGVAAGFDKGQMAKLADFGDAASKGFGALRGVLDAFTSATKDSKPADGSVTPTQAIANLIGLFQAGLSQLTVLAGLALQYQQAASGIRALMGQAGQDLAAALGGLTLPQGVSPQALALAGGGTFTVRQEVVHTFSPVQFSIMGENGPWIVRSLQIDGKSRAEVAGMVADALIAAAPSGVGA